jgi:hypothetical protein
LYRLCREIFSLGAEAKRDCISARGIEARRVKASENTFEAALGDDDGSIFMQLSPLAVD